jgi:hypothetical protein
MDSHTLESLFPELSHVDLSPTILMAVSALRTRRTDTSVRALRQANQRKQDAARSPGTKFGTHAYLVGTAPQRLDAPVMPTTTTPLWLGPSATQHDAAPRQSLPVVHLQMTQMLSSLALKRDDA